MRIAFIVEEFPVISETFILNQITGLIDRGHDVDIYANRLRRDLKIHPDVEKYDLVNHVRCWQAPRNRILRVLKGVCLLVMNCRKRSIVLLLRSLNFFKYGLEALSLKPFYATLYFLYHHSHREYDIIHCQFGALGILGCILVSNGVLKGKIVTSFRGHDISRYVNGPNGKRRYSTLFNSGDFFLPNCDFFQNRLIDLGCDRQKIIVLRSGIDCERFSPPSRRPDSNGHIHIVSIGRLVEKKGIEYGIRAVAMLAGVYKNIEYNIVGDGPLRKKLDKLVKRLSLNEIVKVLGWKDQEEIVHILANSHILMAPIVTSRDGDQDAPVNVLKEAMAMGLPVIGTRHGGIPELIEDGVSGFLVPEHDIEALTEKMRYLIENPAIWLEMGRVGRAFIEQNYDINELNNTLVEIYNRSIKKIQKEKKTA